MKKTKLMKSLIGVGSIGTIGIGVSAGITGCGSSDVISSFTITGVDEIKGNVGEQINKSPLECITNTGVVVSDAFYSASNLPKGLTINSSDGVISGQLLEASSGNYTITVTSLEYPKVNSKKEQNFSIGDVNPSKLVFTNDSTTIFGHVNAAINNLTLTCKTNTGYPVDNVTYTPESSLPNGLNIGSTTGVISGTPTTEVQGDYTIDASTTYHGELLKGSVVIAIAISPAIPTSIKIINPPGVINSNVGAQISTSSLTCTTDTGIVVKEVEYSIVDGSLPNDLGISSSTGIISGKLGAAAAGTSGNFKIKATGTGTYAGKIFTTDPISYSIGAAIPTGLKLSNVPTSIDGYTNTPITPTSAITCKTDTEAAVQDAEYSIVNQPVGLSINETNGSISGTPTVQQSGTFTIIVTSQAFGLYGTAEVNFNIDIANTILISPETLDSDKDLANACNLKIDDGALKKKAD
jgi:hypothetical protein